MIPSVYSLVGQQVVIWTTWSAANDDKFGIRTTLGFQCIVSICCFFCYLNLNCCVWNFWLYTQCHTSHHCDSHNETPWWRHQMVTFFALLDLCVGNSAVTGEFPAQRSVTWSFDVYFDLRLIKRLSKQSLGWWFETPSRSLWRHCNDSNWYSRIGNDFSFDDAMAKTFNVTVHSFDPTYVHNNEISIKL